MSPTPQHDFHHSQRTGRRRAIAAVAVFLAAAGAIAACSDGPIGPNASRPAPEVEAPVGGAATARAGMRSGGTTSPNPHLWIGREHNRALGAIVPELVATYGKQAGARTLCGRVGDALTRYLGSHDVRDGEGQPLKLQPKVLAALQEKNADASCDTYPRGARLGDVARAAAERTQAAPLSPDAVHLLNVLDFQVEQATSASEFDQAILGVEQEALALLTGSEQAIVLGAASTGRSSYYHAETLPPPGGGAPPGTPPEYQPEGGDGMRRNKEIVRSDIAGCIVGGGLGAIAGGPVGALAGCYLGGVGDSAKTILKQWMQ